MVEQKKWVIIFLIYVDFIKTDSKKSIPTFLNEDLLSELESLIGDLVNCKLDQNKCSIYVIYSTLNYEKNSLNTFVLTNTTLLLQILGNHPFSNKIKFLQKIDRSHSANQNFSVQKQKNLTKIFNKIKKRHPDKKNTNTMLVTWDHGSAFGIFKVDEHPTTLTNWPSIIGCQKFRYINQLIDAVPSYLKEVSFPSKQNKIFNPNYFRHQNQVFSFTNSEKDSDGFCSDLSQLLETKFKKNLRIQTSEENNFLVIKKSHTIVNSGIKDLFHVTANENNTLKEFRLKLSLEGIIEILTNEELEYAITNSFETIDILLMMNCVMMNIHTAYTLKDCINNLVAPEGTISKPAYDYLTILNKINLQNPSVKDITEICVSSCFDFSNPQRQLFKSEIEKWAIFNLDFQTKDNKFIQLINLLNHLSLFLTQEFDKNPTEIRNLLYYTLTNLFDFASEDGITNIFFLVDIASFIHQMFFEIAFPKFDNKFRIQISKFKARLDEILADKSFIYGDKYISPPVYGKFPGITFYPPKGLTMYLPAQPSKTDKIFINFVSKKGLPQTKFYKDNTKWLELLNKLSN
jgi:Clostripain family